MEILNHSRNESCLVVSSGLFYAKKIDPAEHACNKQGEDASRCLRHTAPVKEHMLYSGYVNSVYG